MKPTLEELKDRTRYRVVVETHFDDPFALARQRMRRPSLPMVCYYLLASGALALAGWSTVSAGSGFWGSFAQVFGGFVVGSIVAPVLALMAQAGVYALLGARSVKVLVNRAKGVAVCLTGGFVTTGGQLTLALLASFALAPLLWMSLALHVAFLRGALAMMAFAHMVTCVGEVALLDRLWSSPGGRVFCYDVPEEGTFVVVQEAVG